MNKVKVKYVGNAGGGVNFKSIHFPKDAAVKVDANLAKLLQGYSDFQVGEQNKKDVPEIQESKNKDVKSANKKEVK